MSAPVSVAPKSKTPLDLMIDAVGMEAEAVRRQSRADIFVVTEGVRVAQAGTGATYVFSCATRRLPSDEDRVVGDFDGARVDGCVVALGNRSLTLALEADLGPTIAHGRVMIDRTFLWTSLRDRLAQLRQSPGVLNARNVDLLTGRMAPTVGMREPALTAALGPALNHEQSVSQRQALGSDVFFGWGPPGTGKTVVCVRVIADGFYAAGLSTLLAAPTNKAVDLALRRVLERLEQAGRLEDALAAGHIVRVGPISDPELLRAYGAAVSLDAIVAARALALKSEREQLVEQEARISEELRALQTAAVDGGPERAGAAAAGGLRRNSVELREGIAQLERRARSLRADVLNAARVVATTGHRAYMPEQVERTFDAVVLDEAGFTNLPAACCAAARARSHVVVMGDFRQLGAIVTSKDPLVKAWIERDPFHAAGVVDALERRGRAPGLVALRVQHRSDPAIAAVCNAVTYKHSPLVTHQSVLARAPLPSPWGTAPLLLVDTSPLRSFVLKAEHGDSRRNEVHAAIVRWLVNEIDAHEGLAGARDPDGVVVLSPFRDQVRLLRTHFPRVLLERGFDVSTVHRYQGDERGTVVLDLVDARGLGRLSGFLSATRLSDAGARLINVGASRARRRLIVVADVKYLLRHAPRGPVRDFVDHVSRFATRIELPPAYARRALTHVARWEARRGA